MRNYILKRLLLIVPMMIGISLILFVIMHIAPGDPAGMRYGLNPEISATARARFNDMYGLDKPVLTQYLLWMKRFVSLDFGNSFMDDKPVISRILERLPATLILQGASIALILLIAIPIGVISAVKRRTILDRVMTIIVFTGYSMPSFWLALILIFVFGFKLGWFPVSGMDPWYTMYLGTFARIKDLLWHLTLPVIATSFTGLAALSRYTRSSVINALGENHILTERAKGLTEGRIIMFHALKNALLPIITVIGLMLPALVSGSFIFEVIFSWPGMGRLGYEAIMNYDYPVVMGVGVISAFLTLTGILISDIVYAVVDPRIRYGKK